MAANDYEVRSTGTLCPVGYLASDIGPDATVLPIANFSEVEGLEDDLVLGMGVMVNGEIMRLDTKAMPNLTVARGCADTIPSLTPHPAGSVVWFFSRDVASDEREYAATETVGVKLPIFTGSGGSVPLNYTPAHSLTFNWRQARPYPPGNVRVNDTLWHEQPFSLATDATGLVLTWAHRDRLVQADQLVGHNESSVGPEAGVTYLINVLDDVGATVRSLSTSDTTWTYTRAAASADFGADVTANATIELQAIRGGLESLAKYTIAIEVVGLLLIRVTENGDKRVTESGNRRVFE